MSKRTFTQTVPFVLIGALLGGAALHCDKQGGGGTADLSVSTTDQASAADLSTSTADLSVPADLATPADMRPLPDMAGTPGDRCIIALPLPTDNTARDGNTTAFSNDYQFMNVSSACMAAAGTTQYKGKDVVYAVAVPAGKKLTVTLTPKLLAGTWYPMLALIADCDLPGPSCLGMQDTVTPNSADRVVTYTNAGLATQNLFVLVDTFDAAGAGQFSIKAALN